MREGNKGGEINPVDPQLEEDGGESAEQAIDGGKKNRPAAFRKTLKLPGKERHGCPATKPDQLDLARTFRRWETLLPAQAAKTDPEVGLTFVYRLELRPPSILPDPGSPRYR